METMSGADSEAEAPQGGGSGASKPLKVLVVGDVMLGRLVDQIFPTHNEEPENSLHAQMLVSWPSLESHTIDKGGSRFRC